MLNELITQFQIKAEVYHNAKVCGNWRIQESHLGQTCYHMPTINSCILHIPEQSDITLNAGDMVLFPREIPHSMTPAQSLYGAQKHVSYSEDEVNGVGMLCGRITFQHVGFNQLLDALPNYILIRKNQESNWLESLFNMVLAESLRGVDAREPYQGVKFDDNLVLNHISELLFIFALRHYIEHTPKKKGLLALLAHVKIKKAIAVIHKSPEKPFSLQELAQISGMSRTQFSIEFKRISHQTPMQYLLWWRMQLAWTYLNQGETVTMVSLKVGYLSESAFSKAFQRVFEQTPGIVRKAQFF